MHPIFGIRTHGDSLSANGEKREDLSSFSTRLGANDATSFSLSSLSLVTPGMNALLTDARDWLLGHQLCKGPLLLRHSHNGYQLRTMHAIYA